MSKGYLVCGLIIAVALSCRAMPGMARQRPGGPLRPMCRSRASLTVSCRAGHGPTSPHVSPLPRSSPPYPL